MVDQTLSPLLVVDADVVPVVAPSGPFYFARVADYEPFGIQHLVEDELIYNAKVVHTEADIPTLTIEIRNPRRGLIGPGVKRCAWFSWYNAKTNVFEPLFFGSIVAIPADLAGETIQVVLTAKPKDFVAQKNVLAAAMRVLPYYSETFVADAYRSNADTVLNGYTKLWHVDRLGGTVSTSDVIDGEDGVKVFTGDDAYYDSVKFTLSQSASNATAVEASVGWQQTSSSVIDLGQWVFDTYTGDGIVSDWPKKGATLQGGWSVDDSSAVDVYGTGGAITANWSYHWQNDAATHNDGDTLNVSSSNSQPVLGGPSLSAVLTTSTRSVIGDPSTGRAASTYINETSIVVPLWRVRATLKLQSSASRTRTEVAKFTVAANLQPVTVDVGGGDIIASDTITLPGGDVSATLADPSSSGYFATTRGLQDLEYAILVGRAHVIEASRIGKTEWDCPWERAIELSCRMNATLHDDRLPGAVVLGKITQYSFEVDGDNGQQFGSVVMLSTPGLGASVADAAGDPVVFDADVYDADVYEYANTVVAMPAGDVGYAPPVQTVVDDGIVFPVTKDQILVTSVMHGSKEAQAAAILSSFQSQRQLSILGAQQATSAQQSIQIQQQIALANQNSTANALKNNPVWLELVLPNLRNGPFGREYDVALTDLELPMQFDLGSGQVTVVAPSTFRDDLIAESEYSTGVA